MLWNKENKFWSRYEQSWTTEEFLKTLDKVYTYAKCTSAAAYTTTHKLDNLFDLIHYQHGFYFQVLGSNEIYVNDHKIEPGKLYNLSIIFNRDQILAEIEEPEEKEDYINYNIRYAIANGLAVAANSNLFRLDGAHEEFLQLLSSGTSGTAGLPLYSQYNLSANYTKDDVYGVFNSNFDQLGYAVPNYFTPDVAIEKLLSNFRLVDVVSDVNMSITELYESLEVDSVQLFEKQIILLINQNDPTENAPYEYANQTLTKVEWFNTDKDLNLLTLFVKEGLTYKSKEFFLSRNPDGTFPSIDEAKFFETGDNLLIRNKVSYKLLQSNETRDGFYFTKEEPIISANFTDNIIVDGNEYTISANGKHLLNLTLLASTSGTSGLPLSTFDTSGTSGTSGLEAIVPLFAAKKRIVSVNGKIYFVSVEYPYTELWSYDTALDTYQLETVFSGEVIDFCFTTNKIVLLFTENSTSSINLVQVYDLTYTLLHEFLTNLEASAITAFESVNDISIFYTTSLGIYQYYTDITFTSSKTELIIDSIPTHLVLDADGDSSTSGSVFLSWIDSDNQPRRYSNEATKIGAGLNWLKDEDYLIYPESKKKQGDWEIVNGTLYLKGLQVSGTSGVTLPKIDTTAERFFDGKVDYVTLDSDYNTNLARSPFKNLSSFTIDFTLNPKDLKPNANVFYFGEKRPFRRPLRGNYSLYNLIQEPSSYITFSVNHNGFPAFIVKNAFKQIALKSSKPLTIDQNNNISITWDYTSSRISARMYINGELVGTYIDQVLIQNKVIIKPTLDIRTIPFDVNVFGKSEFLTHPFYNGYMSEVRVWNKVLNQAQINVRAGAPIHPKDNLRLNLMAYWPLKDTDYIVDDQIANRHGSFIGGLGSDAILPEITNPEQIIRDTDYLYILNKNGLDNIYRVHLKEEYVQQLLPEASTSGRSIKSIQVDANILYYLEGNTIYKYDHVNARFSNNTILTSFFTPSVNTAETTDVFDFAVNEAHTYYLVGNDIIRDSDSILNTSTVPTGLPWGTNDIGAMYITNQDKNNDGVNDFINIYLEDNNNKLHILSGQYNAAGIQTPNLTDTGLSYKGEYPLFVTAASNDIKTYNIGSDTVSLRLVGTDRKIFINNIELDGAEEYFNFNSRLQDLTVIGNRLMIISKSEDSVTLWSYDLSSKAYQLFKCQNDSDYILNTGAENVALDYFSYNGIDYLILGDDSRVSLVSVGIRTFSGKVTFSNISLYPITEVKAVSEFEWDIVSKDSTGLKYFNIISLSEISLWQNALTHVKSTKGWWVADFGVAYSHLNENYGTSGSLQLLTTVVKEDLIKTKFHIDRNFNTNNFIVPQLNGTGWVVGKRGLIIKTSDYGTTWEALQTDSPDDFTDVSFYDETQGIVVGRNGVILYTFNGGDIWEKLEISQVNHKHLNRVIMYQKSRALIVGQGGLVIHLTLTNKSWRVDKVLVPSELAAFDGETDTRIHTLYKDNIEDTTIISDIVDLKLYKDHFYLASENYIIKLKLDYVDDLITFTNDNFILPEPVKSFDVILDPVTQETTILALTPLGDIISSSIERIKVLPGTNLYQIENTSTRNVISIEGDNLSNGTLFHNNVLYKFNKDIYSNTLFSGSGDVWTKNPMKFQEIDPDTNRYFKPRLLFLDYYLGRKINIQLEPGEFVYPEGTFNKKLLDCYTFNPGDYVEFSEYGVIESDDSFTEPFDYAVIRYKWTSAGGNDLDTKTGVINFDPGYDNDWVGWSHGSPQVGPYPDFFYMWGGDNTGAGVETVLVNFNNMAQAFPSAPKITMSLNANWYGMLNSGDMTIEFETYKGGTMSQSGYDFINTGGELVNRFTLPFNVSVENEVGYEHITNVVYDTATKLAKLSNGTEEVSFELLDEHLYKKLYANRRKNQRNFLAFQDYWYLNRRVQDGGLNTYGKVEKPRKYNKRLTAVSDYENYSIETIAISDLPVSGSYASTASAALVVSETASLVEGLYETTKINKIKLFNTNFVANAGDVLSIQAITNLYGIDPIIKKSLNYLTQANDKLVIVYSVKKQNISSGQYVYNIDYAEELVTLTSEGYLDLPGVGLLGGQSEGVFGNYVGLTAEDLAVRIVNDVKSVIQNQSNTTNFTTNVQVHSIEWMILDDKIILREKSFNDLLLWDQFSPDLLADLKHPGSVIPGYLGATIRIKNLNYFDSLGQNLFSFRDAFDKHLLSDAYELIIDQPNKIHIKGKVNNYTKYHNLETTVTWGIDTNNYKILVKYPEDLIYGPNYEIISILENLDPVFTEQYELDMPVESFGINGFPTNEFTVSGNIIYATKLFADQNDTTSNFHRLDKFLPGTFVDITKGNTTILRCYIVKKEYETNYLGNERILFYTDRNLNVFTSETSTTVSIRSRNKLIEISKDLEFTDDVNFPTPATEGLYGTSGLAESAFNKSVYNFTKTSKVYANYLLNDDNIKKHISAVVHVDTAGDLVMSVVNWLDDPNFAYRPVDAFEMGRDFKPKKGITVRPYHYNLVSDWFQLKNIDFANYTFVLTDGLSLQAMTKKYPWILNAELDDAVIGENADGLVWYMGNWYDGRWDGGTWYSGTAYNINWLKGDWYSKKVVNNLNIYTVSDKDDLQYSTWLNGFWGSGTWHFGRWFDGTFYYGTFVNGEFYGGEFLDGLWKDGKFLGGTWKGGTWLSGEFSSSNLPARWEDGTWLGGDFKNGVWINGIWDQTSLRKSRFGTETSPIKKAIWEFGLWKNGEFHDKLNEDEDGNPLPSTRYKYSIWKNGIWKKGLFFGGTFQMGRWFDGIWYNGLLQSKLDLKAVYLLDENNVRLDFDQPHGFKSFSDAETKNKFTIIGDPNTDFGYVTNTAKFLGTNTEPKTHEVLEFSVDGNYIIVPNKNNQGDRLLNESNLLINPDFNFPGYLKMNINSLILTDHSVQFWLSIDEAQNVDLVNHQTFNIALDGTDIVYTVNNSELRTTINPGDYNFVTAQLHKGVQELWINNEKVGTNNNVASTSGNSILEIAESLKGSMYELKVWNFNLDQREIEDSMSNYQTYSNTGFWNTSYYYEGTSGTSGYAEYILGYYPLAGTSGLSTYDVISQSYNGSIEFITIAAGTSGTSGTSGSTACIDYTLPVEIVTVMPDPTHTSIDYINGPKPVTHWINGQWLGGIWEMGYWENGLWNGGIWINGVFERGQYGE